MAADRLAEYEEILGYHLEQAYRYRVELGPPDDHARSLAERAGTLLAAAARRSAIHVDVNATIDLIERVVELLPPESADRRITVAQAGWLLYLGGRAERAERLLEETREGSLQEGDERAAAWASWSLMGIRNSTSSISGAEVLAEAERLRDQFERMGDDEGAGQAELMAAMAAFMTGRAGEATSRARDVLAVSESSLMNQLEAARWIGASSVWGPSPTSETIRIIREGGVQLDLPGAGLGLARMLLLQGNLDEAREETERAARCLRERGDRIMLAQADDVRGELALLDGDVREAIRRHQASYEGKTSTWRRLRVHDRGKCRVCAHPGRGVGRGGRFATIAFETSSFDDIASQAGGKVAMARVLAHRGEQGTAETLANEAVVIMEATDYLDCAR